MSETPKFTVIDRRKFKAEDEQEKPAGGTFSAGGSGRDRLDTGWTKRGAATRGQREPARASARAGRG